MNPRRCRVFMGVTLSETGGAQKVVYQLLEGLPEDRFDITLGCGPGGVLLDWVSDLNMGRRHPIHVVPLAHLGRSLSIVGDARTFWDLLTELRHGKYDIAHFHSTKMGLLGRFAASMACVPTVFFTVHGWGVQNEFPPGFQRSLASYLMRAAAKRTTTTVCVTNKDRELGIQNGWTDASSSCVIYNGAPKDTPRPDGRLRDLLGVKADTFVIGTVGRLVEAKHPELALDAFTELKNRGATNTHLVFIGDGPLRDRCHRLIHERGLENQVTLLGERQDAAQLMADLSCLLHLSRYESFPLVTLEAMRAGVPIVATGVGGLPEQVSDGETGFLVCEDAQAAADRLATLMAHPERARNMGKAAIHRVQRFSLDSMIDSYKALYDRECPTGHAVKPLPPDVASW